MALLSIAVMFDTLAVRHGLSNASDREAIQFVGARIVITISLLWSAYALVTRSSSVAGRAFSSVTAIALCAALTQSAAGWDGGPQAGAHRTARQKEALAYLIRTETFEMPLVGFGAVPSTGALAMRIVARSPAADAAFEELLRKGRLAGQLYALCGLRRTDPHLFRRAIERYVHSAAEVPYFSGCVLGGEQVGEIARAPGAIQLGSHESYQEWIARRDPTKNVIIDISGGGYTLMFLDHLPGEEMFREAERRVDFSERADEW
jgi:hypothetical protein